MRAQPTAMGYVDPEADAHAWQRAQVQRLAKHLGYLVVWPRDNSLIPLADQVRQLDVDCVIIPSPDHLDALELNSVMAVAPVESVTPRLSFARWLDVNAGVVE
jgi:hypothetical protein